MGASDYTACWKRDIVIHNIIYVIIYVIICVIIYVIYNIIYVVFSFRHLHSYFLIQSR